MRLIVAGTDTDVGKTVVSALLVQGLAANYWKPVQSGLADGSDSQWVQERLGLPPWRILKESYRLRAPVSPHWAAEQEQVLIDPQRLSLPAGNGPLVVETAGGVMTPLGRDWLQIDQIRRWGLPLVLVARSGLGTLNHTLLTLEALRHRSIAVLGLVLNGPLHPDNPRTLAEIGGIPVLAQLPRLEPLTAAALQRQWLESDLPETLRP
jgi:dethiobiotin synthetase